MDAQVDLIVQVEELRGAIARLEAKFDLKEKDSSGLEDRVAKLEKRTSGNEVRIAKIEKAVEKELDNYRRDVTKSFGAPSE